MNVDLRNFLKLKLNDNSQASRQLLDLFQMMLQYFESTSNEKLERFSDVYALIEYMRKETNNEYHYFWEWLYEHGLNSLDRVASIEDIQDTDDLLDFLDYRKFILESDIHNNYVHSVIESVVDSIEAIAAELKRIAENAAAQECNNNGIDDRYSLVDVDLHTVDTVFVGQIYLDESSSLDTFSEILYSNLILNYRSPAVKKQDFLL